MPAARRTSKNVRGKIYHYWIVRVPAGPGKRAREIAFRVPRANSAIPPQAAILKAEAERYALRLKHGLDTSSDTPHDVGISRWLDGFVEHMNARPGRASHYKATVTSTVKAFRLWLAAQGAVGTLDVTPGHIDGYTTHMEHARRLKPHTVRNNLQVIRQAVSWAVDAKWLPPSLERAFRPVSVPRNLRAALTPAQIEVMLQAFGGNPLYPVVLAATYTGIRRGALCRLLCSHVNLAAGRIIVQGDSAKNRQYREVGIHDRLRPVLGELLASRPPQAHVFTHDGRAIQPDYVSKRFHEVMTSVGLGGFRFHDLRHTCASLLADAGLGPFDLQRVMGWSDVRMAQIYVHSAKPPPDMNLLPG